MMTMAMDHAAFSELLRTPNAVVDRLANAKAIRLRRRDAADLILMQADQVDQECRITRLTSQILLGIMASRPTLVAEVLPLACPWARFLPAADLAQFASEFVAMVDACEQLGNTAPLAQLVIEWKHTAEIHADPALYEDLTNSELDDFGTVTKPDARQAPENA